MDELEISGRRYLSAARAAKEHKYHSDYIGQLVRGGKVVGQKVGRAWYIDADSLSEYLGKEIPARGPVAKKEKVETTPVKEKISVAVVEDKKEDSFERPVAEPKTDVRGLSEESPQEQEDEREVEIPFIMPLRKSGRSHVIAAMGDAPVKTSKNIIEEPVVEKEVEVKIEEPVEVFIAEEPQEILEEKEVEEETYIPLKITKEEPEDSFYKVSRKGLRYVKNKEKKAPQENRAASVRTPAKEKGTGRRAAAAVSLALVAGMLSLGAGVLMSYYLHSITTVQDSSQTSSVILSN